MTQVAPLVDPTMAAPDEAVVERRVRPLGIVLLVLFQVLNALSGLAVVAGLTGARQGTLAEAATTGATPILVILTAIGVLQLAAAVAAVAPAPVGLVRSDAPHRPGSRASRSAFYVWSNANFFNLTIFVISAFYLNQHEVKSIFLAPRGQGSSVVLAVEEDDR